MAVAARLRSVELALPPVADDDRSADRRQLRLTADSWAEGAVSTHVTVHDLSATGFRAEGYLSIEEGAQIEVDLPTIGVRAGRIIWTGGRFAGCAFMAPLTPDQLRQVLAAAPVVWGDFGDRPREAERTATTPAADPFDIPADRSLGFGTRVSAIMLTTALLWLGVGSAIWVAVA